MKRPQTVRRCCCALRAAFSLATSPATTPHPNKQTNKTTQVALVTAATAGIGLAVARRLAQEGARVFICSRRAAAVDAAVESLRAEGLDVRGAAAHVGDEGQLRALVEACGRAFGPRIDVLVSNAAVNPVAGPIVDIPLQAFDKIFDVNVKSALALAQLAAPRMGAGGSVVVVTSVTAFR